jgi:hypothetical protein
MRCPTGDDPGLSGIIITTISSIAVIVKITTKVHMLVITQNLIANQ